MLPHGAQKDTWVCCFLSWSLFFWSLNSHKASVCSSITLFCVHIWQLWKLPPIHVFGDLSYVTFFDTNDVKRQTRHSKTRNGFDSNKSNGFSAFSSLYILLSFSCSKNVYECSMTLENYCSLHKSKIMLGNTFLLLNQHDRAKLICHAVLKRDKVSENYNIRQYNS